MESRVLSRAVPFPAAAPRLPRLPRDATRGSSLSFSSVSAKAIGDGGNLICGRQLRASLLIDSSGRSSALKPCLAASSSPAEGSDSAGEAKVAPIGFFDKYPALVTGFFFFMWYFLNVIFNILNKKIYNYFPYPYFVSVVHLLVGVVYCLISWAVGLPKRAPIDANLLKLLIPVAVCHALGHVTSNVSFAAVAVSFTHTIKALEPFFNAAASQFILGQTDPHNPLAVPRSCCHWCVNGIAD
ncbi:hypothetical protein MLD38_010042 [Melastoma candidum]|uniref:Uncharacterized protein n=1 Tax=Melastoma candidum TaxID=119954 RepID=A0ACB9R6X7_9MYRT|nr:hypothetical protein MLD38_010042 [Melastoma candidum]